MNSPAAEGYYWHWRFKQTTSAVVQRMNCTGAHTPETDKIWRILQNSRKKEILIVWLRAENTDQATYKPDLEACTWPIYKAATISVLGGCAMVLLPALPQICPKYRPQKVVLVASGALSLQCWWENCSDFLAPSLSPIHCKHLENEQNDKNSVYHPVCFSVSLHFFARYF